MSQLAVGKDVVAFCSRCKLALSHIIVVMASETKPDKVTCNTCKATHKFKDPSRAAAAPKKSASGKKSGKKPINTKPHADLWQDVMNSHSGPSVKYTTGAHFDKGDVIDHPSFGLGVVEKLIDQNKIEVMFKAASKMLAHNLK